MVWDVSYTCDICGKRKGDANHWWMVMLGDVPCYEEGGINLRFSLMPWNPMESQNQNLYHLCGQGCALQALERFMTYGAIDADQNEPSRLRAQSTGALL